MSLLAVREQQPLLVVIDDLQGLTGSPPTRSCPQLGAYDMTGSASC